MHGDFPRLHRPQKDDPAEVARHVDVGGFARPLAARPEILCPAAAITRWQAGDLVLFYGRGWQSRIISLYTRGPSHVGIILMVHSKPMLYESTTLCDLACELCQQKVQGVQAHTPELRIAAYDGRVERLPIRVPLWPEESDHLTKIALTQYPCDTPYNLEGALESGTRLKKWRCFLPYPDLGSIFCSALNYDLLMNIGKVNCDDPTRYAPADLVKVVRRTATHRAPELVKEAREESCLAI